MPATLNRHIIQQIVHPDGLLRIEFLRQQDGSVLVAEQRWSSKGQSWCPPLFDERFVYDTYAEAFALTASRLEWLAAVFNGQRADHRHRYHLELLRGLAFHPAASAPSLAGDHYHCDGCWQTLSVWSDPEELVYGYVTRYVVPLSGGDWQWHWVCDLCFEELHSELQWTLDRV